MGENLWLPSPLYGPRGTPPYRGSAHHLEIRCGSARGLICGVSLSCVVDDLSGKDVITPVLVIFSHCSHAMKVRQIREGREEALRAAACQSPFRKPDTASFLASCFSQL